ncbi:hypothetical protein [Kribbella sp. NPDC049227]|uniref:hypothetical protein n=1 Tax=Kribbella sp. NPDC049227 TaxID=3364113 RepID=UPI00371ADCC2
MSRLLHNLGRRWVTWLELTRAKSALSEMDFRVSKGFEPAPPHLRTEAERRLQKATNNYDLIRAHSPR